MKKFLNFRPLFYCFIAFMGAILFAKYLLVTNWIYIILFIVGLFSLLAVAIWRKKLKIFVCLVLFFSAGIAGYCIDMFSYNVETLPANATIIGRVTSESNNSSTTQKIILDSVTANGEQVGNKVLVYVYGAPYLHAGDIVEFSATVNPSGSINYYGNFKTDYYKYGIRYTTYVSGANVEITGNNQHLNETVQLAIKEKLLQNMSEENAAIAYATLVGDKSEIDAETNADFRTSGIAHILAISGLHVGILVGVLYFILKKCKAKNYISMIIIVAVLAFYCYLCGFSTSVVRASIMSICLLASTLLGRKYDSLSAIGLAGLIILIFRPLYAFDVGFQLSFGCVIGIALFYKTFFKALRYIKFPKFLASPLAISVSTQVLILPVLISAFGNVSFLSVFLNVLVIPVFALAYIITLLFTPLLFLSPFFGNFLWFADLLLEGIKICANFVSNIPYTVIPMFNFAFGAFLGFYALTFILSRYVFLKKGTKFVTSMVIIMITLVLSGVLQYV